MPWFYCDACGDSIKKPKVAQHLKQCYTSSFTCIDCSRQFDSSSVHGHTQCVTEHDKYAKGATKPGGFAQNGYFNEGAVAGTAGSGVEVVGEEYLSSRAPWVCSVCNVTCTSRQTLESHATGTKHVRRVRARQKTENGDALPSKGDAIDTPVQSADTKEGPSKKKEKNKKKEKSRDSSVKSELKKLVKKELKKNDGSMKKKKLMAALDTFLKEHKYSEEKFEKKLLKSGDFEVDGKVIKLKS